MEGMEQELLILNRKRARKKEKNMCSFILIFPISAGNVSSFFSAVADNVINYVQTVSAAAAAAV